MNFIMGIVGVFVLLGLAFLMSDNKRAINYRTVGGAFAIQVVIGAFVLYVPAGKEILQSISTGVADVIAYGNEGIQFLFGDLAKFKVGFIFAINVLPVIVFFSALIAVLYYLGIMTVVINFIGGGLQKALGTSRAESLSATANIFVGQTEAPLVVRPFIRSMTQSELFAVMVGGLASIAGSVLAGYAGLGVKIEYLVAASFMAAPGGLLMAKIIKPETETPKVSLDDLEEDDSEAPANVLDAAAAGASSGMMLALNVGAMLIAFVGLIALANGITGGIGGWFGHPDLTIQTILGVIFSPLAFLIGVPWEEALQAGSSIGQKLVVNEFVAFLDFAQYLTSTNTDIWNAAVQAIQETKPELWNDSIQLLKESKPELWNDALEAIKTANPDLVAAGLTPEVISANFPHQYFIGDVIIKGETYTDLNAYLAASTLSEHTQVIISFALCGFANFSSIAILLGGLGSLAPNRRADIASMGIKAVIAASLANLMSATLAGLFLS